VRRDDALSPRSRWRRLALLLSLLLLAASTALSGGCGDSSADCYPTDWEACACADGARGYHQCGASGEGYGACDCSGVTPGAATLDAGDAGDDGPSEAGALAPFLATCAVNADCASDVCFSFTSKGPHCTLACNADADCPAPSPGCSHMGVCKPP
jgi:hypothetical protein